MLRRRRTIDSQARTKNGAPDHSTTGIESTSWNQTQKRGGAM